MDPHEVTSFTISQDNFTETKGIAAGITVQIIYYYDSPAGYEISMVGPGGTVVVCPRPCPTYFPPAQS